MLPMLRWCAGAALPQCLTWAPSLGTLFRASQFLAEELPIRLAHRVQELETLPDGLGEMPSVKKVQDWYAQSFEVWVTLVISRRPAWDMTHGDLFFTCRKSQHYLAL